MTRVLGLTTSSGSSFYRQQVRALRTRGIEYTSLEVTGTHRASDDGIDRRSLGDYVRFYPRALRHALGDVDLVHANFGLTAPFGIAQPIRPVVVSLWGGEFTGNRYASLIRRAVGHAEAIIVPSVRMQDRIPPAVEDRTHVVPFPIDTDRFQPRPRAEAREAVGWDTDASIVLFPYATGRFEKNYPLASRVVDGLDGDVALRTVANEPHDKMPDYMNASDALLVTSRWESGPMSVKEALACNLPVVSRPVGFVPELLEDVPTGRIGATERDLRAGLREVLSEESTPAGRELLTGYDRTDFGRRLEAVYADCLEAGSS